MKKFEGVYPPVITIFDEHGKIDLKANKLMADYLIESGVDGITYLGTTGEFGSLTLEEKKWYIGEMSEYINSRVKMLVGVGDTCLDNTLSFLDFLSSKKVDGVLLVNTYFSVYTEEAVKNYFLHVEQKSKLPIIIYNFPALTGFNFSAKLVRELLNNSKKIVGIKDTINDIHHVNSMIQLKKEFPDFHVFAAFEDQALDALILGVDGFINATANFSPETTVSLYSEFRKGCDFQKIVSLYNRIFSLMKIYEVSQPLFLACKEAVYQTVFRDQFFGERIPGISLSKEQKLEISLLIKSLKIGDKISWQL